MLSKEKMKKIYNLLKNNENFEYEFEDFNNACENISDEELEKIAGGKFLDKKGLSLALTALLTPSMIGVNSAKAFTKEDLSSKVTEAREFVKKNKETIIPISIAAGVAGATGLAILGGYGLIKFVEHSKKSPTKGVNDNSLNNIREYFKSFSEDKRKEQFDNTIESLYKLIGKYDLGLIPDLNEDKNYNFANILSNALNVYSDKGNKKEAKQPQKYTKDILLSCLSYVIAEAEILDGDNDNGTYHEKCLDLHIAICQEYENILNEEEKKDYEESKKSKSELEKKKEYENILNEEERKDYEESKKSKSELEEKKEEQEQPTEEDKPKQNRSVNEIVGKLSKVVKNIDTLKENLNTEYDKYINGSKNNDTRNNEIVACYNGKLNDNAYNTLINLMFLNNIYTELKEINESISKLNKKNQAKESPYIKEKILDFSDQNDVKLDNYLKDFIDYIFDNDHTGQLKSISINSNRFNCNVKNLNDNINALLKSNTNKNLENILNSLNSSMENYLLEVRKLFEEKIQISKEYVNKNTFYKDNIFNVIKNFKIFNLQNVYFKNLDKLAVSLENYMNTLHNLTYKSNNEEIIYGTGFEQDDRQDMARFKTYGKTNPNLIPEKYWTEINEDMTNTDDFKKLCNALLPAMKNLAQNNNDIQLTVNKNNDKFSYFGHDVPKQHYCLAYANLNKNVDKPNWLRRLINRREIYAIPIVTEEGNNSKKVYIHKNIYEYYKENINELENKLSAIEEAKSELIKALKALKIEEFEDFSDTISSSYNILKDGYNIYINQLTNPII